MPIQQRLQQPSPGVSPEAELPTRGPDRQSRYGNGFLAAQLAASESTRGPAADVAPTTSDAGLPGHRRPPTQTEQGVTPAQQPAQAVAPAAPVAPLKIKNPLPVVQGEQRRTVLGVQIIGRGVSPSALDGCEALVRLELGQREDMQRRMQHAHVALVIVPRDRRMTDLAEFANLKGTSTIDGRAFDDVRGSGGMAAGGLWAIAVPEENLVEAGTTGPLMADGTAPNAYADGYSVGLHELAHTVEAKGLTSAEKARVIELYAARKLAGGRFTEVYGASNEREYFAQSSNCYFGQNAGVGQNGAAWLQANDPAMFAFLGTIYGPAPAARPTPEVA